MKIYFKNLDLNKLNLNKLEEYKKHIYYNDILYSDEGIFKIKNNKIIKLKPQDECLIYDTFENYEIVIDNSFYKDHYEVYQLPYNHINIIQNKYIYKLRDNAPISLEIIKNDNTIKEFYIKIENETSKDQIQNYINKEEIISFLSLLI
tara:strand:+ start:1743 stop:2186 length:444 start_codon:yes stop_codon:yes gene_type:complete